MKILFLIGVLFLSACEFKVTKGSDAVSSSFSAKGNCHLVQGAQDAICVEYDFSYSETQMDTDCDSQNTAYSSHSINTHFYSYLPLISCRSGGRVGLCTFTHRRILYFDNEWTSTTAESDCVSLSGSYKDL